MADFCLDCWNKINKTNDSEREYVLSKDTELCEGCGEWKRVVIAKRNFYDTYNSRYFVFPGCIIYLLLKLFKTLCSVLKHKILKR